MVRIQSRISRKRYLHSKQTYKYERISLHIPRKFHNKVKPFLKQDLNMNLSIKGSSLVITLTPRKNVSARRKHPAKTGSETLHTVEF